MPLPSSCIVPRLRKNGGYMEYSKIKILGIAPYEGLKSVMVKLAEQRNDIELNVYVGDLQKGVEIARENFHNNYDAVISRGGTAEMLEKVTNIPVIEITLSVYDVLRAIKLAENYADRYAIVGFSGITNSARLLCGLLQYHIDIFTIHDMDEVQRTLADLKRQGYRMILCDMITNTTAKRLGLNAILITSGTESIEDAFDMAVKINRSHSIIKKDNSFLRNLIQNQQNHTIAFDGEGRLIFSTPDNDGQKNQSLEKLAGILQKNLQDIKNANGYKSYKIVDNIQYLVHGREIKTDGDIYTAFYIYESNIPQNGSRSGITFTDKQDAEDHFFNSFYSVTGKRDLQETIDQMNQNNLPIMICGEPGTGKDQAVRALYSQSRLKNNPLITIDCSLVTDKGWIYLTERYDSPFYDNDNTIYLKHIELLTDSRRRQLLSIITDMNLAKRNRMIFSCVYDYNQSMPEPGLGMVNYLSCLTMHLPPLRDQTEDFPTFISLFLGTLNVKLAKQIIGLESKALELLQNYDWPYNHMQLKRVLTELAVITSTPYIQPEDVTATLEKEQLSIKIPSPKSEASEKKMAIDLNQPLDQITNQIIQTVLDQNGGNQSVAAKQLGISRTTMWRLLKKQ